MTIILKLGFFWSITMDNNSEVLKEVYLQQQSFFWKLASASLQKHFTFDRQKNIILTKRVFFLNKTLNIFIETK